MGNWTLTALPDSSAELGRFATDARLFYDDYSLGLTTSHRDNPYNQQNLVSFYAIPFSMMLGGQREDSNFNPDFFLKLEVEGREVMLVIKTKKDKDTVEKNRAKREAAHTHFDQVNQLLTKTIPAGEQVPLYIFFFLSPNDYNTFFAMLERCSIDELKNYRPGLEADLLQQSKVL